MIKKESKLTIKKMTTVGILGGISIVLGMTPLGFIPVGPTRATIMHIPVIIGAIVEGPLVGGLIGLIFGLFSMFQAATNPTPVSFVFLNPVVSILPRVLIGVVTYYVYEFLNKIGFNKSNWTLNIILGGIVTYLAIGTYKAFNETQSIWSLAINIILIACTILIGFYSQRKFKGKAMHVAVATVAGTLTNTIGVLSSIYFLYGEKFVTKLGQNPEMARKIIFGIGVTNGIPEMIVGIVVVVNVIAAIKNRVD
ncbi:MAG: ECF transporter S component [Tissierellia bacterium]|nr:ECF transporter S component [Tissierellia bacterium]